MLKHYPSFAAFFAAMLLVSAFSLSSPLRAEEDQTDEGASSSVEQVELPPSSSAKESSSDEDTYPGSRQRILRSEDSPRASSHEESNQDQDQEEAEAAPVRKAHKPAVSKSTGAVPVYSPSDVKKVEPATAPTKPKTEKAEQTPPVPPAGNQTVLRAAEPVPPPPAPKPAAQEPAQASAPTPTATPISAPAVVDDTTVPSPPPVRESARRSEEMPQPPSGNGIKDYVLGSGDKLKIIVFGEADLSGEFQVSSTGTVSMPLIGPVKATGNTVSKVEAIIADKLREGYMKDPRVSVEVNNYRPFFIVGEVMKPGSYDYVNGMTVITAVALAGGYTYRADKDGLTVRHGGQNAAAVSAKEDSPVMPGDVVSVSERFF